MYFNKNLWKLSNIYWKEEIEEEHKVSIVFVAVKKKEATNVTWVLMILAIVLDSAWQKSMFLEERSSCS